jgi:hypothetical protein
MRKRMVIGLVKPAGVDTSAQFRLASAPATFDQYTILRTGPLGLTETADATRALSDYA